MRFYQNYEYQTKNEGRMLHEILHVTFMHDQTAFYEQYMG